MSQTKRGNTEILSLSLPSDLSRDLRQIAKEDDVSVSQLTKRALKNYIWKAKWQKAQRAWAPVFAKLGIKTDDDVEKYFAR